MNALPHPPSLLPSRAPCFVLAFCLSKAATLNISAFTLDRLTHRPVCTMMIYDMQMGWWGARSGLYNRGRDHGSKTHLDAASCFYGLDAFVALARPQRPEWHKRKHCCWTITCRLARVCN